MSSIQLSPGLIKSIQTVLQEHDQATSNQDIAMHYLSAIIGYQLAALPGELNDKQQFLGQLYQFSNHVLSENCQPPEPAEAYGVWEPEKN